MTAHRLPETGHVKCAEPVSFFWDGQEYQGFAGDTLASALLANNVGPVGRSFKYHRPRGIMSAGVEEAGALVTLGTGARKTPNVAATTVQLIPGLEAFGQNAWPNVRHDIGGALGLLSPFLSAGFYYKTFMGLPPFEWGRGTGMWMRYEHLIRKAAGMGAISLEADPDRYEQRSIHCDLFVVGSGPAGLAAAARAASAGLEVILCEQDFKLGGQLLSTGGSAAEALRQTLIGEIKKSGVRILCRTTCLGLYDDNVSMAVELVHLPIGDEAPVLRERLWRINSRHTILATGAIERQFVFSNNDRPGIMSASSARTYLNRFGVLAGQSVVIGTNNDSAYEVGTDLAAAGAEVTILDARSTHQDALKTMAGQAGLRLIQNSTPANTSGRRHIQKVHVAQKTNSRWRHSQKLDCDMLLVSGGWSPIVNLLSHRGVKPRWSIRLAAFLPDETKEPISCVGAAAGIFDTENCIDTAHAIAEAVVKDISLSVCISGVETMGCWRVPILPLFEVKTADSKPAFVDPTTDVTTKDVRLAHQEGFVSVEHLKRYTTLGMGGDQGKSGNVNGLAIMSEAQDCILGELGTTTFRPPYTPVSLGALAGYARDEHYVMIRRTPLHNWLVKHSAVMTESGHWKRCWWFRDNGENVGEAAQYEASTVRETVGICDVSTLGKIAVQGLDAADFLNRVFVNGMANLSIGRGRYGVMLRDDGIVKDDAVVLRIAEDEFFLTSTTLHSTAIITWLENLAQCRWPNIRVHINSQTDQWAALAVAGPRARDTVASILRVPEQVADDALPFMAHGEFEAVDGQICRVARVSFSGELAYEVYVPAGYGPRLADMLWDAAKACSGCLYGVEALDILRIEKGHVADGEIDGRTTLGDLGLGAMASDKKHSIGDVLRRRPMLQDPNRSQLVGIVALHPNERFAGGAILYPGEQEGGLGAGWVSTSVASPALRAHIGLGFIDGGSSRWLDQSVVAIDPIRNARTEVRILDPRMFDPENSRLYR